MESVIPKVMRANCHGSYSLFRHALSSCKGTVCLILMVEAVPYVARGYEQSDSVIPSSCCLLVAVSSQ